jgi:hypothetical protein
MEADTVSKTVEKRTDRYHILRPVLARDKSNGFVSTTAVAECDKQNAKELVDPLLRRFVEYFDGERFRDVETREEIRADAVCRRCQKRYGARAGGKR